MKKTNWDKEWDNLEIPTTEELGMNYGESKSYVWQFIAVAIFLGIVAGMILSTPKIVSAFDACTV